ncbi:DUF4099 domain-containing protein [Pedobacter aquatilis]|uniref:DUF4099 domain-containing protein n=1 Tax=Pedobacter aquatilis TaxID=351343 RepID=UPI00292D7A2A|nr:DUF4099 domain-containing protein [Pedobacter aquatilis]
METLFHQNEFPVDDLGKLGLAKQGALLLEDADIMSMRLGRRSGLILIKNLDFGSFEIAAMEAKISLQREESGKAALLVHPVYNLPRRLSFLTERYEQHLLKPSIANVTIEDPDREGKALVVEYDAQTKEFISYSPENVQAPSIINADYLSPERKEDFRRGMAIELSDGTIVQHRATERLGIASNREKLYFFYDGRDGASHILFEGIANMPGSGEEQKPFRTNGFTRAAQWLDFESGKFGEQLSR